MNKKTDDNYISLEDAAEYLNIKPVSPKKMDKTKGRPSSTSDWALMEVQTLRIGCMGKQWKKRHKINCDGKGCLLWLK